MAYKINKKPARRMSFGGILTNTAVGAATGSAAGPVGTIVGGFTGLIKGLSADVAEREAKWRAGDVLREKELASRNQQLTNKYGPSQYQNTPLMPMGGLVPGNQETVELEKGEPFMSPDGQINKISDKAPTHAQGGVPITLPSGTKVLGKKPATDEKTFKQLGSKLEKQQSKYQKILKDKPSRIAEQTASRMLDKINKQFNELFDLQGEDTQNTQQFPNGGTIGNRNESIKTQQYGDFDKALDGDLLSSTPLYHPNTNKVIAVENYYKGIPGAQQFQVGDPRNAGNRMESYTAEDGTVVPAGTRLPVKANGGIIRKGGDGLFAKSPDYFESQQQGFQQSPDYFELGNKNINISPLDKPSFGGNINIGNTASTIGALAPSLYNLYQGSKKPDQLGTNSFANPYESEVRATMKGRRYNIQPEIEADRLASATYYRNLREGAPSQSQYLGGLQAGAISEQRAIGQTMARKQNADNDYLAQQAQVDMSLGQANSQRQQYIEDVNARSKAARDQFTTAGLSQLGQYAQVRQQMSNQMVRDAQRLNLLPALVQNFSLNERGQWTFKETGEVVDNATVMNYIKGNNIK